MKSKKGSIDKALTWTVALIIIVGLIFFYIIATGFIAGKKKIGGESNNINYDSILSSNSYRILEQLMDEEIILNDNSRINVENGIKYWAILENENKDSDADEFKEKLIIEIGKLLSRFPSGCNVLFVKTLQSQFYVNSKGENYETKDTEFEEEFEFENSKLRQTIQDINPVILYEGRTAIEMRFYSREGQC